MTSPDEKLDSQVETFYGNFLKARELSTWLSSAEVIRDFVNDWSLGALGFYTNNHALYAVEDGEAILYFGIKDSSIFRYDTIYDIFTKMRRDEPYHIPLKDVLKAKQSSLRVKIADLDLIPYKGIDDLGYIRIDFSDPTGSGLNTAPRKLAEAVYGSMEQDNEGNSPFGRAMNFFNEIGLIKTLGYIAIAVPMAENVLEDARDGPIVRACAFNSGCFCFGINGWEGYMEYRLRGIQRPAADNSSSIKLSPLEKVDQAYEIIWKSSTRLLAEQMGPAIATKLATALAMYLKHEG